MCIRDSTDCGHARRGRERGTAEAQAGHRRHHAHPQRELRRLPGGHHPHCRRVDVLPVPGTRFDRGGTVMSKHPRQAHPSLLVTSWQSLPQALVKLDPRHVFRNPVMFVVWVGSVLTTVISIVSPSLFAISVAAWLWLPSSSRTSPRPSPRDVARLRPTP